MNFISSILIVVLSVIIIAYIVRHYLRTYSNINLTEEYIGEYVKIKLPKVVILLRIFHMILFFSFAIFFMVFFPIQISKLKELVFGNNSIVLTSSFSELIIVSPSFFLGIVIGNELIELIFLKIPIYKRNIQTISMDTIFKGYKNQLKGIPIEEINRFYKKKYRKSIIIVFVSSFISILIIFQSFFFYTKFDTSKMSVNNFFSFKEQHYPFKDIKDSIVYMDEKSNSENDISFKFILVFENAHFDIWDGPGWGSLDYHSLVKIVESINENKITVNYLKLTDKQINTIFLEYNEDSFNNITNFFEYLIKSKNKQVNNEYLKKLLDDLD